MSESKLDIQFMFNEMSCSRDCLAALDSNPDYPTYIKTLLSLGRHLRETIYKGKENNKEIDLNLFSLDAPSLEEKDLLPFLRAFHAFKLAWMEISLSDSPKRIFKLKAQLNLSDRRDIHLGLCVFEKVFHTALTKQATISFDETEAIRYNHLASEAIRSYQTYQQKIILVAGKLFAAVYSVACGLLGASGVIASMGISPFVLCIAGVIFFAATFVNWLILRYVVPGGVNDIFGKDQWFEGMTHYRDEVGKKQQLTVGKKILLGLAAIFSLSVGIMIGVLVYSSVILLPAQLFNLACFAFLNTPGAAIVLFPIAVGIGAVTFVCVTLLMLKGFSILLRANTVKEAFFRNFQEVKKVFSPEIPENQLKSELRLTIEKMVTYSVLSLLLAIVLFGLGMFSYLCSLVLGQCLSLAFGLVPSVALGIACVFGMGFALIGQIPFVIQSKSKTVALVAAFFRGKFAPESSENPVQENVTVGDFLMRCGKYILIVINAVGNGILGFSELSASVGNPLAVSTVVAGILSALAGGIQTEMEDPGEEARKVASSSRVDLLKNGHYEPRFFKAVENNSPSSHEERIRDGIENAL